VHRGGGVFDRINRINGIKQGKRLPQRRGELGERRRGDFFDRIYRIYTINRNRKMKEKLPRRRGELDEWLRTFKRCPQHLLILCVFASLRETLFRVLDNKTGGPAFLAMLARPSVGTPWWT